MELDRIMSNENSFRYTYSAPENQEVLNIRKKYLPQEEAKLEERMRLDHQVQSSGVLEVLCTGIGGALEFVLGMCLSMNIIGNTMWQGILLGQVGAVGMLAAYPVYRRFFEKAKTQHTPRILALTEELTGNN